MKQFQIYRTYLVRFRQPIEAPDVPSAIEKHRETFEKCIKSVECGEIEVLDLGEETAQLMPDGRSIVDLVIHE